MAKGGNIFIKPGGMAQKATNAYENLKWKKVERNNIRLEASGFEKLATSLVASNNNRNDMDLSDDDDNDYVLPDGEGNLGSSSDEDEETQRRISRKHMKAVSAPQCTPRTRTRQSTVDPTPSQELQLEPDSLTATSSSLPSKTVRASTAKRGINRGINTERLISANGGNKLVVEVPLEIGVPVGANATRFATWLGIQIRMSAPLKNIEKWDDISPATKAPIIQAARDKFEILDYDEKEHVVRGINHKCQKLYRTWRHNMKEHYEKLVQAGKDPYKDPFRGVSGENWAWMIANIWTNTEKEKIVEKRKKARADLPWNHTMGSQSFAAAMSAQEKKLGQQPHMADFFKSSHYNGKKKKWVDPICEAVHVQLEARRQEVEALGSTIDMPQEEMAVEVLGKKYYPKEYSVHSKPPSKRSRASSSEEVRVLKNQVDTLKEVCERREADVDTLKDLCKSQQEKIRAYDEKFERFEAMMTQYMEGGRIGASSSR